MFLRHGGGEMLLTEKKGENNRHISRLKLRDMQDHAGDIAPAVKSPSQSAR